MVRSSTDPSGAQPVGGTSVSAPVFASLVSLLNQVSLKMTGKTLGFVSPLLYKMHSDDKTIFQDVLVGDKYATSHVVHVCCVCFFRTGDRCGLLFFFSSFFLVPLFLCVLHLRPFN